MRRGDLIMTGGEEEGEMLRDLLCVAEGGKKKQTITDRKEEEREEIPPFCFPC